MTEKLIIKDFVGIKELEIEIKQINILIGPQASGKSVCAKLLFYFKNFVWEMLSVAASEQTKRHLDSNYSKTFEEYFPSDSWGSNEFFIRYEFSDVFIEIIRRQDSKYKIYINYSDFFKKTLTELRTLLRKSEKKGFDNVDMYERINIIYSREFLTDYFTEKLSKSIGKEAAFAQLFIPAGRSFFANLQSSIFSFLSSSNALDPFLRSFGSTYENIKRRRFGFMKKRHENRNEIKDIQEEINRLIEKSLCGKHVHEKGKDFLELPDGRRISVANLSSGQQEMLPLTIMLAALPFLASSRSGQTVYIEEPEAHLFPNAQRSVIELIATVFNYRKDKLQFFITTHSPYILTAINNLLQAGSLYRDASKNQLHQLEKIIPRYKSLNVYDLSAYVLENGKCSNIICFDTGLIDANIIDSVSDDLAIQFDKLLNLV
jgi:ABC-type phosphate transport system ATPase subunit